MSSIGFPKFKSYPTLYFTYILGIKPTACQAFETILKCKFQGYCTERAQVKFRIIRDNTMFFFGKCLVEKSR